MPNTIARPQERSLSATQLERIAFPVILFLNFFATHIARSSWAAIIPLASGDLGLSNTESGVMMSAFYVGYVVVQAFGGLVVDRIGPKRVIVASQCALSASVLAFSRASSMMAGVALRTVMGLSGGLVYPCIMRLLNDRIPAEKQGRMVGIVFAAPPLAVTSTLALASLLTDSLSWRSFILFSTGPCLLALGLSLTLRESRLTETKERPGLTHASYERDSRDGQRYNAVQSVDTSRTGLRGILAFLDREFLFLMVGGVFFIASNQAVITWLNAYLTSLGRFNAGDIARVASVYGLIGLVGSPLWGSVSDWMRTRKRVLITNVVASGLSILTASFIKTGSLFSYALVFMGVGLFAFSLGTLHTSWVLAAARKRGMVATGVGFCNSVVQLGGILGPVLFGLLLDYTHSYSMAWAAVAVAWFVAALLWVPVPDAEVSESRRAS